MRLHLLTFAVLWRGFIRRALAQAVRTLFLVLEGYRYNKLLIASWKSYCIGSGYKGGLTQEFGIATQNFEIFYKI